MGSDNASKHPLGLLLVVLLLALGCRGDSQGTVEPIPVPAPAAILRMDPLEGPVGTAVTLTVTGLSPPI